MHSKIFSNKCTVFLIHLIQGQYSLVTIPSPANFYMPNLRLRKVIRPVPSTQSYVSMDVFTFKKGADSTRVNKYQKTDYNVISLNPNLLMGQPLV